MQNIARATYSTLISNGFPFLSIENSVMLNFELAVYYSGSNIISVFLVLLIPSSSLLIYPIETQKALENIDIPHDVRQIITQW